MAVKYGSLPFDAQIAFFRKKLALPTRGWTDIWQPNHDHAFVVAGATKMALIEDMQAAVQQAIEQGTTLAEFRKKFDKAVSEHGWSYQGSRGWRSRLIYQTNLRTSHAAGRYAQLQKLEYWQYHHSIGANNPREQHLAWDGLVLPKDDSFWETHYPPNGWGCRCYVTGMSKSRMQQKGLNPSASPDVPMRKVIVGINTPNPRTVEVPEGVSPGFAYAPGQSAWMYSHIPVAKGQPPHGFENLIPNRGASDLLVNARTFPSERILPKGKSPEFYVQAFLKEFNADIGKPVTITDHAGDPLVIGDAMFKRLRNGKWKATKNARAEYTLMMADVIRDPDEIWVAMEWNHVKNKAVVRKRYVSNMVLEDGTRYGFTVFEYDKNGWSGVTTFAHEFASGSEFDDAVLRMRKGIRLYKKQ